MRLETHNFLHLVSQGCTNAGTGPLHRSPSVLLRLEQLEQFVGWPQELHQAQTPPQVQFSPNNFHSLLRNGSTPAVWKWEHSGEGGHPHVPEAHHADVHGGVNSEALRPWGYGLWT